MSRTLAPVAFERSTAQFLDGNRARRAIGSEVAVEIDRQVKQMLDKAYNLALEILQLNRDLLETAAQTLLEKEVLEGAELKTILAGVQRPVSLNAWLIDG